MNVEPKPPALDANEEIPALIETLLATEQRLEELTGGEMNTVAGRDGRTFLLWRAQEQLRYSEAACLDKVVGLLREHETDQGDFLTVNPKGKQIPGCFARPTEHLTGILTLQSDGPGQGANFTLESPYSRREKTHE